jgi:hypothetical protein
MLPYEAPGLVADAIVEHVRRDAAAPVAVG